MKLRNKFNKVTAWILTCILFFTMAFSITSEAYGEVRAPGGPLVKASVLQKKLRSRCFFCIFGFTQMKCRESCRIYNVSAESV